MYFERNMARAPILIIQQILSISPIPCLVLINLNSLLGRQAVRVKKIQLKWAVMALNYIKSKTNHSRAVGHSTIFQAKIHSIDLYENLDKSPRGALAANSFESKLT